MVSEGRASGLRHRMLPAADGLHNSIWPPEDSVWTPDCQAHAKGGGETPEFGTWAVGLRGVQTRTSIFSCEGSWGC